MRISSISAASLCVRYVTLSSAIDDEREDKGERALSSCRCLATGEETEKGEEREELGNGKKRGAGIFWEGKMAAAAAASAEEILGRSVRR